MCMIDRPYAAELERGWAGRGDTAYVRLELRRCIFHACVVYAYDTTEYAPTLR